MAEIRLCGRPRLSDGAPCGFRIAPGQECRWHGPDVTPADRSALARAGGLEAAARFARVMPPETPRPRWRSRQQIVDFLEDQAHLVRTGVLDRQIAAEARMHAETALKAYELAALEKLDVFERVISGKARRIS
jgi:hypothetical protein